MSQLGHQQTSGVTSVMSDLVPEADIKLRIAHVRSGQQRTS